MGSISFSVQLFGGIFILMLFKKKTVRIPSKLYHALLLAGGDDVIACYSHLKAERGSERVYKAFKSKNNKLISHYSLLRKLTSLSLHTLKKHVPTLVSLGLVVFESNGDVSLVGNKKLKQEYNGKLVPIFLGKKFTDTKIASLSVRVHANERSQKIMISKKTIRSEKLMHLKTPQNSKQLKDAKAVAKKFGETVVVNKSVVLSNQGFGKLKHGLNCTPSLGQYWKRKLKNKGFIQTSRRFNKIAKMSFQDYMSWRRYHPESDYLKYTYINGYISKELIGTYSTLNFGGKSMMH